MADLLSIVLNKRAVKQHKHDDIELHLHFGLLGDVRFALGSHRACEQVDCGSKHQAYYEFELDEVHPHLMPVISQLLAISYQEHISNPGYQHCSANYTLENVIVRVLRDMTVHFATGEIVQNNSASDKHGRNCVSSPAYNFGIKHIHFSVLEFNQIFK